MNRARLLLLLSLLPLSRSYGLFNSSLDEPQIWRQADTANYALDFFRDGLDILHPSVCWMGHYKTVILEFPLYEAIVAGGYILAGGEHLWIARLVNILFWLGSLLYFYKCVQCVRSTVCARIAGAVYTILPLGVFYSRAVHVDFTAIFFSHAMLYHWIRAFKGRLYGHAIAGTIFGALAFLIKAPYAFYLILPLITVVLSQQAQGSTKLLGLTVAVGIPAFVFLLWRHYVEQVNASAPDWYFIPDYFKFTSQVMNGWYFGDVGDRLVSSNWVHLLGMAYYNVTMISGATLCLFSIPLLFRRDSFSRFVLAWLLGLGVYLLIFFNLIYVHDYYHLPFVAGVSLLIALGLDWIMTRTIESSVRNALLLLCVLVLTFNSYLTCRKRFFFENVLITSCEKEIRSRTKEDELVVTSSEDTDPRDPRLLYGARRHGFSVATHNLTPELLERLHHNLDTRYVAILSRDASVPRIAEQLRLGGIPLLHGKIRVGTLYFGRL